MSGCRRQILSNQETPEERVSRLLDEFGTTLEVNIHSSMAPFLEQCSSPWEKDQFITGAPVRVALVSEANAFRRHLPVLADEEQKSFARKVADRISRFEVISTPEWLESLIL